VHSSSDIGTRFGELCKDDTTVGDGNGDDTFEGDNVIGAVDFLEVNGALKGDNDDDFFEGDNEADGAFEVCMVFFDSLQN